MRNLLTMRGICCNFANKKSVHLLLVKTPLSFTIMNMIHHDLRFILFLDFKNNP